MCYLDSIVDISVVAGVCGRLEGLSADLAAFGLRTVMLRVTLPMKPDSQYSSTDYVEEMIVSEAPAAVVVVTGAQKL